MCSLPTSEDKRYLNRKEPNSDAGIYQIDENTALVQSVDFFTPVVDDPYLFGEIAAANALSDVYAVGGTPLTALNLVCFPCNKLDSEILKRILQGGYSKVGEAGAVVVGGHSIEDEEPKFGLAITGIVNPRQIISSSGAKAGDLLVLTKPLGTGVITTALKGGVIDVSEVPEAVKGMTDLNDKASRAMKEAGVLACTDITGFGLMGHAKEMAEASNVCLKIKLDSLPLYPMARELAEQGFVPGGTYRNQEYFLNSTQFMVIKDERSTEINLIADPQTSGGLLMAVPPSGLSKLFNLLDKAGVRGQLIGKAEELTDKFIVIE